MSVKSLANNNDQLCCPELLLHQPDALRSIEDCVRQGLVIIGLHLRVNEHMQINSTSHALRISEK